MRQNRQKKETVLVPPWKQKCKNEFECEKTQRKNFESSWVERIKRENEKERQTEKVTNLKDKDFQDIVKRGLEGGAWEKQAKGAHSGMFQLYHMAVEIWERERSKAQENRK